MEDVPLLFITSYSVFSHWTVQLISLDATLKNGAWIIFSHPNPLPHRSIIQIETTNLYHEDYFIQKWSLRGSFGSSLIFLQRFERVKRPSSHSMWLLIKSDEMLCLLFFTEMEFLVADPHRGLRSAWRLPCSSAVATKTGFLSAVGWNQPTICQGIQEMYLNSYTTGLHNKRKFTVLFVLKNCNWISELNEWWTDETVTNTDGRRHITAHDH